MLTYNPNKSVWYNPNIEYLFDDEIREYDMRDAGFSIIQQYKLLPPEKIQELAGLSHDDRNKRVGIMQRDKSFSEALLSKFAEVRTIFINLNELDDDNIISVKKDAFFVIGRYRRTTFGKIEFRVKNEYSSYIRLPNIQNMEFYYSSAQLEVKGMGDSAVNRHRLYMLDFVRKVISGIEAHNTSQVKRLIKTFVDQYKGQELPEEYYLEFNNMSKNLDPIFNFREVIIPLIQIVMKELN